MIFYRLIVYFRLVTFGLLVDGCDEGDLAQPCIEDRSTYRKGSWAVRGKRKEC